MTKTFTSLIKVENYNFKQEIIHFKFEENFYYITNKIMT